MFLHRREVTAPQIWYLLELITLEISGPRTVQVAPFIVSEDLFVLFTDLDKSLTAFCVSYEIS